MIKGVWQELFAPFLTLPASFKSSVVGVWILSKPSLTESLCQFFLAPSSYCGLGTSTRKINTLISSTAAALRRFLCLLWSCSNPPEATRVPRRGLECRQGGGSSATLTPPVLHMVGHLKNQILPVVPSSEKESIPESHSATQWPTHPRFYSEKSKT